MLQRLQHLYLLIVSLICALLLGSNPTYFVTTSADGSEQVSAAYRTTTIASSEASESLLNMPVILSFGSLALLCLVVVFLYQNRKIQLKLIGFCLLLTGIAAYALFAFSIQRNYFEPAGSSTFEASIYVSLGIIILLILAYRGILKDERLVRSMDRLR
jgi:glucan phosphoethanolaminetransferase (alkaline phosphatase superfamily)